MQKLRREMHFLSKDGSLSTYGRNGVKDEQEKLDLFTVTGIKSTPSVAEASWLL
jgi:hypothetical protein